jgi:hypothetical protein
VCFGHITRVTTVTPRYFTLVHQKLSYINFNVEGGFWPDCLADHLVATWGGILARLFG